MTVACPDLCEINQAKRIPASGSFSFPTHACTITLMNDGQKSATEGDVQPQAFQPGQTVSPGAANPVTATPDAQPTQPPAPVEEQPPQTEEDDSQFLVDTGGDQVRPYNGKPLVTWTASEFIAHDKSAGWYGILALVGIILAGLVYLTLRDIISTSVVLVCTVLFGVYAARKPRQVSYQLDDVGLSIGNRLYSYHEFRSFSVVDEGPFASIALMPFKRFAPMLSVYFDPADEQAITDILGDYLPHEPRELDMLERALKKVRF